MTTAGAAERITEVLRDGRDHLENRRGQVNEAVTRSVLIDRVLEELGYPPTHRSPENAERGVRPDDLCYLRPVGPRPEHPALVLEAKRLNADFDRIPPGRSRVYSPDRQIRRYLETDRISGPDTIGVLTDGIRWRLYERSGVDAADSHYFENFDFNRLADQSRLDEFIRLLSRPAIAARTVPASPSTQINLADGLFDVFTDAPPPPRANPQGNAGRA